MAINTEKKLKLINEALAKFDGQVQGVQKNLYDKILNSIDSLQYKNGRLLQNNHNLNTIAKIQGQLSRFLKSPENTVYVKDFAKTYTDLQNLSDEYFLGIDSSFKSGKSLTIIKESSLRELASNLVDIGVQGQVVQPVMNTILSGIRSGQKRSELINSLQTVLIGNGDGRLVSYAKTIADTSINIYDRAYESGAGEMLGLEWYIYTGGLKDTSREFCIACKGQRYFHKSEFPKVAKGILRNRTVSTAGFIKGTNAGNIQENAGGWNCDHRFTPVSEASVPKDVVEQIKRQQIPPTIDENSLTPEQFDKRIPVQNSKRLKSYETKYSQYRDTRKGQPSFEIEQGAIESWTKGASNKINAQRNSANITSTSFYDLTNYINDSPKYNGTLYRGSGWNLLNDDLPDRIKNIKIGNITSYDGISNFSSSLRVAQEDFAQIKGKVEFLPVSKQGFKSIPKPKNYNDFIQVKVIEYNKVNDAVAIYKDSMVKSEMEYLQKPNSVYKIEGVNYWQQKGKYKLTGIEFNNLIIEVIKKQIR